jgi:DNA-binding NarL/FixJ family response regulator
MDQIILADSQAIFRAGIAKLLALDEEFRIITQCADVSGMMHAITTFPGAIVVFASSLHPNMGRLRMILRSAASRAIMIAENNESAGSYLHQGIRGLVFRNSTGMELVECVHRVAVGDTWVPQPAIAEVLENDIVGTRVRDRLTPKEMSIVALIVLGCRNRTIALRLNTTEQVIKNYLGSIYNKTGVSDRLELALFTFHHPILAQAAEEIRNEIEDKEQHAALIAVA